MKNMTFDNLMLDDGNRMAVHTAKMFAQLKPDHAVRIIREHKEKT